MLPINKRILLGITLPMIWVLPTYAQQEIPLEYFALRSVVSDVGLSPDGKYLALLKIPNRDGDPIIEVYETDDLDVEPFTVDANPMEITAIAWTAETSLVLSLRQQVRTQIDDFNEGVYDFKLAQLDMDERKINAFNEVGLSFVQHLPNKPGKIIVSYFDSVSNSNTTQLGEAFRPRAYYEMDVVTGTKRLLIRGKIALGAFEFDPQGNPLFARGFDLRSGEFIWYHRPADTNDWREVHRQHEDDFADFSIASLDYPRTDYALVIANNGHDKAGLWTFNLTTGEFDELVYRRPDADVYGVRYHSNVWTNANEVVGVSYFTDKLHVEYFDDLEGATYAQLETLLPWAHDIYIVDRTKDGATLLLFNVGPRDPGTYYLLKDGQIQTIGSRQPLIESESLADVRFIKYKARDGEEIPAYLTVPKGEAPHPLVVLPHGGPFVHETVAYDEWAQMLASRGYMVLQPQYRGSKGYGMDFYMSAFKDGGQGGYKMQDDKDDGALHLIEEGLVERDRVAMFGWSYGGYAALAAATRTPQIYQCAIAGAAVSDPLMQVNYYRYSLRGAQQVEQLQMWDDSLSPIKEVEKVNIPILVIHGDVDQRVPVDHARKYLRLMEDSNKPHKYVELKGADHFSSTLFYDHKETLYTSIIDYLRNDCGSEGL